MADSTTGRQHRPQWIPTRDDLPGIALALGLGLAALGLTHVLPPSPLLSDVVIAIVLGAVVVNTRLRSLVGLAPAGGAEREPDRAAAGLRFTGKWILRLGIILMGMKVQTGLFGRMELALIAGVVMVTLPSTFFVAHALAAALGVRRPLGDLLAGGTMICGASAVNAIAPVAGAQRSEQGVAVGVVFAFSVVALFAFHPLAVWVGLSPAMAGLWSGLSVNDLSSAIAVGKQMGGAGGVMAAASKSVRVLMLAPTLLVLSFLRREGAQSVSKSAREQLPTFVLGYIALAVLRALGDRLWPESAAWSLTLTIDRWLVDLTMTTVSAAIGLHIVARTLLGGGIRALAVGGGASVWMALLSLLMIASASRGASSTAALFGVLALGLGFAAYRVATRAGVALTRLRTRFAHGSPLSLTETTTLLEAAETDGTLLGDDDSFRRSIMHQLHPTIGELVPVRESPLAHGEGCRWVTYWQGTSGWALVAVCRDPGSATPIHAHPHRLLGKTIEGVVEELRFADLGQGSLRLTARGILGHDELVTTDGLASPHLIRVVGSRAAIDLQLRGPEQGGPGRVLRVAVPIDTLQPGAELNAIEETDQRPGHGGEGAGVGKITPKETRT
jgi:uncharacterized integral membrane protein (TIGR00698 family)